MKPMTKCVDLDTGGLLKYPSLCRPSGRKERTEKERRRKERKEKGRGKKRKEKKGERREEKEAKAISEKKEFDTGRLRYIGIITTTFQI